MSSIYPQAGAGGVPSPDNPSPGEQLAQAREKLGEAGEAVRGEAAHFAERTRDQVVEQVEEKKAAVTDALGVFADAIRKAGEELGGQDQTFAAKMAGQAADGLQSFTRSIAGKSPEAMLQSARELGRSNPTALLAGAVLAGVAIGRFARSSAPDETQDMRTGPSPALSAASPADRIDAPLHARDAAEPEG